MGWFWADTPVQANPPSIAPHPVPTNAAAPPPSCPMHKAGTTETPFPPRTDQPSQTPLSCPVKSPNHPLRFPTSPPASQAPSIPSPSPPPSQPSTLSRLNPLNYMPNLTNAPIHTSQRHILPLDRETSSIPRGDADSNWEYPSPQQMYNAMLRKGYTETPTDAVESMVAVHNFLNEGAWNEIVEWESIFSQGLAQGWSKCSRGEENRRLEHQKQERLNARLNARRTALGQPTEFSTEQTPTPKLLRFQGRPNDPTPRSRLLQFMAWAFPNDYNPDPPFDRHDWYVARTTPNGSVKEVRYVIDYYAAGSQESGEPVFYLDIRPALDGPTPLAERVVRWGGDVWWRARGAEVADKLKDGKKS